MKTKYILISLGLILVIIISLIMWSAFRVHRTFVLYKSVKHNFCLLVDDRYTLEISENRIKYTGGLNSGLLELREGKLDEKMFKTRIGDFDSGYQKLKNLRVYEYILSENYILKDTFENVRKMPINLVPLRRDCAKIEKKFKEHQIIFN